MGFGEGGFGLGGFGIGETVPAEPIHVFQCPTHEEPIRTRTRPLNYFRLTWASSVLKVNGTFVQMRTPAFEFTNGLVEGVDYFKGGYVYKVTEEVKNDLIASGFNVVTFDTPPDTESGFGAGGFGEGGFGQ